jgi:shikimate dehydrogenase
MSNPSQNFAVVGHPIEHSKSPLLHQAAFRELGLDWSYSTADVEAGELSHFLSGLSTSFKGLSVTMPHKFDAHQSCDSLDLLARKTGSVNTMLFDYSVQHKRALRGFNTDVYGITRAFADAGVTRAHQVAIIGSGATASSAIAASAEMGTEHIFVLLRNLDKGKDLIRIGQECGVSVSAHSFADMSAINEIDCAISTLPGSVELSLSTLPKKPLAVLLDVAYSPWPSHRGAEWSLAGNQVVSGLLMLAHQALIQVRIFVNGDPTQELPQESRVFNAMLTSVGLTPAK